MNAPAPRGPTPQQWARINTQAADLGRKIDAIARFFWGRIQTSGDWEGGMPPDWDELATLDDEESGWPSYRREMIQKASELVTMETDARAELIRLLAEPRYEPRCPTCGARELAHCVGTKRGQVCEWEKRR